MTDKSSLTFQDLRENFADVRELAVNGQPIFEIEQLKSRMNQRDVKAGPEKTTERSLSFSLGSSTPG
jgi:hypothetical protein